MPNLNTPIKHYLMMLNQLGKEAQLTIEMRYTNYNEDEMIASKYYLIYWHGESESGKKKQEKIKFSRQVELLEYLEKEVEVLVNAKRREDKEE